MNSMQFVADVRGRTQFNALRFHLRADGGQSGRGQPHSKTLSRGVARHFFREVLECGCPLPLFLLATALLSPKAVASTVVAWGETSRPSGSPPSMTTNVPAGLVDAIAIAGGPDVGYAIRSNGSVITWGNPLTPSLS